jgi:hypothetical protein
MAFSVDRKQPSLSSDDTNNTVHNASLDTDSPPSTPKIVKWSSTPQSVRDRMGQPRRLSVSAGEPRTNIKSKKIRTNSDSNLTLRMSRLHLEDTPQGSPVLRALKNFDWSEDKKSELLSLLRQPRQELEILFSSITDAHQELTLVQLIPLIIERDLEKNEEQTYLRTDSPGTLAWTAYVRCKLKKIFTGDYELSELAQQYLHKPPTYFWRVIIERLRESSANLKLVLALNDRICQRLATRDQDPEKIVIIALALQYFIPEVMVCGREHKELLAYAPTLSVFDKEVDLLQQLKWLLIAPPKDPSQTAFLEYNSESLDIDGFNKIITLFKIPSDPKIKRTLPALMLLDQDRRVQLILDLLERDFTNIEKTLWLRDQTAGTVAWRWYITYELSAIFPKSHFRVSDRTTQTFWKQSIEFLKTADGMQKYATVASLNKKIYETLQAKRVDAKATLLHGCIEGYFVHEILEENKSSSYSIETLKFANQLKKSIDDPELAELFTLLTR